MEILDEDGRLFGIVNVIDALVALLVLAVIAAGAALVLGGGGDTGDQTETVTLTVEISGVQPYVAEAIPQTGPVEGGNVTAIENRTVEPATVYTENDSGAVLVREHPELRTVTVVATVEGRRSGGALFLSRQRLAVGSDVRLDFGTTVTNGTITAVETAN